MSTLPVLLTAALIAGQPRAGVDAFNQALADATRRMDDSAIVALWEPDGVSLLPSTRPIVGRAAIAAFVTSVTSGLKGARMTRYDQGCHDVEIAGDTATEWCVEHQVVALADGSTFDGWGKLLLVLHRGADGRWRLRREMWNQAAAADSSALR